ncbi:hypothetical protein C8F04DRAFT_1174045 [Mycena alexandri]|uniref:Uncharacterized protein n=1 Tax=Mycena alexandri TaxID=1745969 RepID=A0AAD6XAC4_9AGAR|nr:hypothetical protein C8F04DRAFT_1174045 [Mycena alexandri]
MVCAVDEKKFRLQIYYRGEVALDYSTSSKKGRDYATEVKRGDNARADALERPYEQQAPIFPVVFAASGAAANAARRAGEKVEVHKPLLVEPEMRLAIGIAARVAFASRGNIHGHTELYPERAPELGRGDGVGGEGVVGGGGDGGAAVQVPGDAVAGVEAAVLEMQLALVPRFGAAADGAEGAGAVIVQIDLPLGNSTETAGSEGGGGAGHGVGGRGRNAKMQLNEAREEGKSQRDQEWG